VVQKKKCVLYRMVSSIEKLVFAAHILLLKCVERGLASTFRVFHLLLFKGER
jgi:hypothetical protein